MKEQTSVMIQIKKGALEYCVLAVIAEGEAYGYEIVKALAGHGLTAHEGTIYPLLARLKKDGLVSSLWRETDIGHPRKYYRVTSDGVAALAGFRTDWAEFKKAVDSLMQGGKRDGGKND